MNLFWGKMPIIPETDIMIPVVQKENKSPRLQLKCFLTNIDQYTDI